MVINHKNQKKEGEMMGNVYKPVGTVKFITPEELNAKPISTEREALNLIVKELHELNTNIANLVSAIEKEK